MARADAATVRAAGGVLWRRSPSGEVEVALVHRPRYDDWSLPKGKLKDGEVPLLGALREVAEETGYAATVGRTLGSSAYEVLQNGRGLPKTVRWWAMRAAGGAFEPGDEVDELRWLTPAAAERLLTAGRDVAPLRLLVEAGTGTTTVLLVRHAHAGSRADWDGEDLDRPLDERGEHQAAALVPLLAAYAPDRIVSAPARRCVDTVRPLATALGCDVEVAPLLGEPDGAERPQDALGELRTVAERGRAAVLCSQGSVVPELVRRVARGTGVDVGRAVSRKGSVWALTFSAGALVDADPVPPLA
jgi:8-oxo-dGTP diphosphatase